MKNRWLREQLARWKEIYMVLSVKRLIKADKSIKEMKGTL